MLQREIVRFRASDT
jgi:chromosome segregation ATPase